MENTIKLTNTHEKYLIIFAITNKIRNLKEMIEIFKEIKNKDLEESYFIELKDYEKILKKIEGNI